MARRTQDVLVLLGAIGALIGALVVLRGYPSIPQAAVISAAVVAASTGVDDASCSGPVVTVEARGFIPEARLSDFIRQVHPAFLALTSCSEGSGPENGEPVVAQSITRLDTKLDQRR